MAQRKIRFGHNVTNFLATNFGLINMISKGYFIASCESVWKIDLGLKGNPFEITNLENLFVITFSIWLKIWHVRFIPLYWQVIS